MTQLTTQIEECQKKIKELQAEHKKTKEALDKAQQMRDDEHKEGEQTDADDKAAAETVKSARDVIAKWYSENKVFMQVSKQPVSGMAAGEAPPPPPPTFEADYGGKQGE